MTTGLHRPKQPALVRARLLDACISLLAEGSPVSIGSIAEGAGVTKGAVQHHFGKREDVLLALFDLLMEEFRATVADNGDGASPAWRYARASVEMQGSATPEHWRAMLVASVTERSVAARWSQWVQADRKEDAGSVAKLVARLAADGLWLSDLLGTYELGAAERQALSATLRQLAQGEVSGVPA